MVAGDEKPSNRRPAATGASTAGERGLSRRNQMKAELTRILLPRKGT